MYIYIYILLFYLYYIYTDTARERSGSFRQSSRWDGFYFHVAWASAAPFQAVFSFR